mmetsp:Transcript_48034/g.126849  ORF Transcript_48034/g.126849 Transcript_48034/m.126849 type:complete len:294 (-) Transcript_48034:1776-2657(-)
MRRPRRDALDGGAAAGHDVRGLLGEDVVVPNMLLRSPWGTQRTLGTVVGQLHRAHIPPRAEVCVEGRHGGVALGHADGRVDRAPLPRVPFCEPVAHGKARLALPHPEVLCVVPAAGGHRASRSHLEGLRDAERRPEIQRIVGCCAVRRPEIDDGLSLALVKVALELAHADEGENQREEEHHHEEPSKLDHGLENGLHHKLQVLVTVDHAQRPQGAEDAEDLQERRPLEARRKVQDGDGHHGGVQDVPRVPQVRLLAPEHGDGAELDEHLADEDGGKELLQGVEKHPGLRAAVC